MLLLLVLIGLLFGCRKREVEDLNSGNNGSGTTTTETCSSSNCINGTCVNDVCVCDYGWTGERCDQKKTLRYIYIDSITVLHRYNNYDDGLFDDYPDLYVKIYDGIGQYIYTTSVEYDARPNKYYTFDLVPDNVSSSNVTGNWTFKVYDRDSNTSDDLLMNASVELYDPLSYPQERDKFIISDNYMELVIYVQYIY